MHSKYVKPYIFPNPSDNSIIADLKKLTSGFSSFCIADNDDWLRFIVANRSSLDAIFNDVLHPPNNTIELCLDKNQFLIWCRNNGISAPKPFFVEQGIDFTSKLRFPIILRPQQTQHSSDTGLPKAIQVVNGAELNYWLKRFEEQKVEPAICESLLKDGIRQFSIGFTRGRNGSIKTVIAEKKRSYPEQCLGGTYVVSSENHKVDVFTRSAIEKLGYYGIGEAEVMFDVSTGRQYLIEINARPWVQFALAEKVEPSLLNHLISGTQKDDYFSKRSKRNWYWLHFRSDLFVCFSQTDGLVRRGRLNFWNYLLSVLKANVFAIFDIRDLKPFVYDNYSFIRFICKNFFNKKK